LNPGGTAEQPAEGQPQTTPDSTASTPRKPTSTNEISNFTVTFRAVSLSAVSPDANKDVLFAVVDELRASPLFDPDPKETRPVGDIGAEEPPGTFTFGVEVRLKRPMKLQ